jgi:hypothetical protein
VQQLQQPEIYDSDDYTSNPSSPSPFVPLETQDGLSQAHTQLPPFQFPDSSSSDESSIELSPLPVQNPNAPPWHPLPPAFLPPLAPPLAAPLAAPLSEREQEIVDRQAAQMRPPISFTPGAVYSTQSDPRNYAVSTNREFMKLSQGNQTDQNIQGRGSLTRRQGQGMGRRGGTRRRYKKRKSKYTTNKHPIKSKKNKINKKKTRRRNRY